MQTDAKLQNLSGSPKTAPSMSLNPDTTVSGVSAILSCWLIILYVETLQVPPKTGASTYEQYRI